MKKINLTINGCARQVIVNEKNVLLDLLREQLHVSGAKQSCDRKGLCGACTVMVNGNGLHGTGDNQCNQKQLWRIDYRPSCSARAGIGCNGKTEGNNFRQEAEWRSSRG